MKLAKRIFVTVILVLTFCGMPTAQEEKPKITLIFSEKCNNFLRYYCQSGNHEMVVNQILVQMKEKGTPITNKLIKRTAQSTPSRLKIRPPAAEE